MYRHILQNKLTGVGLGGLLQVASIFKGQEIKIAETHRDNLNHAKL